MPNAQLPPDARDGENDRPDRPGLHLSEAGRIAIGPDMTSDGLPKAGLVSASDVNGNANGNASAFPGAGSHDPAGETPFDDSQPMLDLRFPEPHSEPAPPSQPGEVQDIEWETADRLEAEAPAPSLAAGFDGPESDAREVPAAVEKLVEISPIFSALDAAEKAAAEAMPQANGAPEIDAFEVGILLPLTPLTDSEDVDAGSVQKPQPLATDLSDVEEETNLEAASEAAAPTEPATDDVDAARPLDEKGDRSSELLHDAAARIAAEASATAEALENLKRLLVHKLPEPDIPPIPDRRQGRIERTEPPPVPAYQPPTHVPVEPPPMIVTPMVAAPMPFADEEPSRRSAAAVGSFLAGFALSWVMGAVLYVFLTSG